MTTHNTMDNLTTNIKQEKLNTEYILYDLTSIKYKQAN